MNDSGKRELLSNFLNPRMAIVEVGLTETNAEAWLRHLSFHPQDLHANIRIFNHQKSIMGDKKPNIGGETMILKDIRAKAKNVGVKNISKLTKADLIRAIQQQEGNSPCYQNIYDCRQYDCLWRPECQC